MNLVGRELEESHLRSPVQAARHSISASLMLVGDPGIGKSALLHFVEQEADGFLTLRAQGVQSEIDLSFGGISQLLAGVSLPEDRLSPGLIEALNTVIGSRLQPSPVFDRHTLGAALLEALAWLAESKPVLVVVDDAHWLDRATRDALGFVARRLCAEGILLLVSQRTGAPFDDLASLPSLHVEGLPVAAVAQLLAAQGAPAMAAERVEWLTAATAGTPLALIELPRLLGPTALVGFERPFEAVPVAAALQDAYAKTIVELPYETQTAVLVAAVLDKRDLGRLKRALRAGGTTVADLSPAEDAGLLEIQPASVSFRHPLVASAVIQASTPSARRRAHANAARALAEAATGDDLARRAWHLAAAAIDHDDLAAELLEAVAVEAVETAAFGSAALAFERSAWLSSRDEARTSRLIAAAEAAYEASLVEKTNELIADVSELSDSVGQNRVKLARLRGRTALWDGQLGEAFRHLSQRAQAVAQAHPVEAAMLLAEAAFSALFQGWSSQALSAASTAAELATGRHEQTRSLAEAMIGAAEVCLGQAPEGVRHLEAVEATVLDAARTDPRALQHLTAIGLFYSLADKDADAHRVLSLASELAVAAGSVSATRDAVNQHAFNRFEMGFWDEAESMALQAIGLAEESGREGEKLHASAALFALNAARGEDHAEHLGRTLLTQSEKLGQPTFTAMLLTHLALLELSVDEVDEAQAHFERAGQLCIEGELIVLGAWRWTAELIECAVRTGRWEAGQYAKELLNQQAEHTQDPLLLALRARCDALTNESTGWQEEFDLALRWHRHAARPFETARTQLLYGEKLRRHRSKAAARQQLKDSLSVFDALGCTKWRPKLAANSRQPAYA